MTRRDRLALLAVGVLGLLAAFWVLALKPQREEARLAGEQRAAAEARLQTATVALAGAEAARASFGRDQAALARLGKAVPRDDDTASLVFQLERAARRAKIDFRAFRLEATGAAVAPSAPQAEGAAPAAPAAPGATAGADGLSELPLRFTFDGDFFALQRLLELVHGFTVAEGEDVRVRGRLLTVQGVALSAGRAGLPEVRAEITAKAYLAAEDVALPTAEPTPAATPAAPATPEPTQAAGGADAAPTAAITPVRP